MKHCKIISNEVQFIILKELIAKSYLHGFGKLQICRLPNYSLPKCRLPIYNLPKNNFDTLSKKEQQSMKKPRENLNRANV